MLLNPLSINYCITRQLLLLSLLSVPLPGLFNISLYFFLFQRESYLFIRFVAALFYSSNFCLFSSFIYSYFFFVDLFVLDMIFRTRNVPLKTCTL